MCAGFRTVLNLGLLAVGVAGAAHAADGLAVPESTWQRWQARAALGTVDQASRLTAASLVGDFYFQGLPAAGATRAGGFRATGGLILGAGSAQLGAAGVPKPSGGALSIGHLALSATPRGLELPDLGPTLPYLGLGYTRVTGPSGLSISADVGVVAQNPGAADGVGRALFGSQSLDAAIRNLRLSPVLQLGVRYEF